MRQVNSGTDLIRHLRSTLRRQRLVLFMGGLFGTGAVVAFMWIALSLVAAVMIVPVWLKISLMAVAGLAALFFFGRFSLARLLSGNVKAVAVRLEQRNADLRGRLVAALQFARMAQYPGYSRELMDMTVRQAIAASGQINFNEAVFLYPLWRNLRLLGISALAAAVLLLIVPGMFNHAFRVYSNPTVEIAPPIGYQVVPTPGSTEWVKYKDIRIGAAVFGSELPRQATIHHRLAGGSWQHTEVNVADFETSQVDVGDSVAIGMTLRQINRSFDYYVEAGRVTTEVQQVDVVDRPRVNGIKLSIFYPEYTGLAPTIIDENNGTFSALVGSRAIIRTETNLPIESAEMVFSDSSVGVLPMKVAGETTEASMAVEKSLSYHIRLRDHLGEKNPDPIEYYITAVPDEYPSVEVLRPGFDVNLTEELGLPLKVRIFDDFGFSSLVLKYTVVSHGRPSEEQVAVIHFSDRIKTEGEVEFSWDLGPLSLYPGDYVVYYLEVADNDVISGPKTSRSRQFVARLPSLDEIIAEAEAESSGRINRTEELLRTGRELSQRLKNAVRKLQAQSKQDQHKADWQQQRELETLAQDNERLIENVDQLAQEMDKSVQDMAEKALLSREIIEKLTQIQELFEEVATPEMREAQRKLMEALRKMDRQALEEALNQFKMSQEELLKRLERTLALLKKLQLEQKMESLVRMAEELVKRQETVNKATDSTQKESLPTLSPTEDGIKSSLEELQKQTKDLQKDAQEAGLDQTSEMKEFSKAVQTTDAGEDMNRMSHSLSQQQRQEASQSGKKALTKLMEMLDAMNQQLLAMKGGDQERLLREMRMALGDANYLSGNQEELFEQAGNIDPRSLVLREMAKSQEDLVSSCAGLKVRVAELGKQSPFIGAELEMLVNHAVQNMELAMEGFDEKKGKQSRTLQREAMSCLNRASVRLMESIQQLNDCKKGRNCNNSMMQLESLCNRQNGLNKQCKGQCSKQGSGNPTYGADGQDVLQHLAGEQGAIRKSLQQLAEEFGQSRQILGRLDDIADEMKKVEEALAEGEVGEQTRARQLRIYSRLLEASRSLQRRDFSEQRKATAATEQLLHVPPQLPPGILDDDVKLEDRLQQYLSGNYPQQYLEQIKAYFKALLQAESEMNGGNSPAPAVRQ